MELYEQSICKLTAGSKQLKKIVDSHGWLVINNVEVDEATILAYALGLGCYRLRIPKRLSGPSTMHLRFDDTKAHSASRQTYFTCGEFPLHTDLSYVPNPPRYLLVLCVEADKSGGGVTTLASFKTAWQRISAEHQALLRQPLFSFENAPNTGKGVCIEQAIYKTHRSREVWRFRLDTLTYPDTAADAIQSFSDALEQVKIHRLLKSGDLLIVDNHQVAHGRTSYEKNSARHFLRTYSEPGNLM